MLVDLLLGLVTGAILALTGAGGGILAVPLLVFGARLDMATAGPIGLLAVGMAAALGAGLGLRAGIVRYRAALLIALAGAAFSPLGLWLAHRIDNRMLTVLFALVLAYVAYRSFTQAGQPPSTEHSLRHCVRDPATGRFIWTRPCARVLALSGTVAGLLSGLLGVGGGFVMVPALRAYTELEMQSVVATSLAVIALLSATGVATSALSGGFNWAVALPFCAGALAGMLVMRAVAHQLGGAAMQRGYAVVAGTVALAMLLKAALA
ncbi:sulfite exporter TauE/SafE family protein [Massilia solisilvae]|uniref:Probable membrane transporter protein n=1 Tax=Massilia solisilvae TaxID=1811225 RepID=A0ABT2BI61_9BURK|nr:sulfite exporter TauE/SafE family protein [Massilia solisilvae]MCS0608203.1 sulfite exporter TauE/SafE family protein [Massilia solisilvae]